jgi:hypothetical protein
MAHSNREDNSEKRKQVKSALKQERAEKVKPKTMWEKLADDKAGIKVDEKTGEETKAVSKSKKDRKVPMENRIAHRRTRKRARPVCVMKLSGDIVRVSHAEASKMVAAGAKYVNKKVWRDWKNPKAA